MASTQRKVKFYVMPGFGKRYKRFLPNPEIRAAIRVFNIAKRRIPPGRLPDKMWDHVLKGSLAGIRECHLAGDVLLIYTHENDVVRMIDVCTHDELMNDGGRAIRNRIKRTRH
jgi:mRNA interferase YafQ